MTVSLQTALSPDELGKLVAIFEPRVVSSDDVVHITDHLGRKAPLFFKNSFFAK